MSEQLWGQDIEQVRELARKFERSAQNLDSARQLIDGAVYGFDGWGANVEQMRDMWSSDLAPSLTQIAEALRGAGETASRNADDQQATTESYDGGSAFAGATASGTGTLTDPFAGVSTTASGEGDDDGGGVLDWFGDRLDDIGDGADWVGDKVSDGVDWAGDKVSDGVEWIGDTASDLGDWFSDTASDVGNWFSDRASDVGNWLSDAGSTIGDSFSNLWDTGGQLWDATGGSVLDGRWPRTTEIVASGLLFGGALVDTALTTGTAGQVDLNLFDDGEPYAGDPSRVNPDTMTIPNNIEDLTQSVTDAYGAGDGTVRVTTIDTPDGPRVIVSVPGTESWNPAAGDNPMDVTGNLVTAGGGTSTMTQAVELAMQNANIPPGAEVMLVGHSQGGMTVADLVSDSDFVSNYNVTNAMTFGSPIDSNRIDSRVDVLEVQHQADVVPRLDLGDSRFPFLPGSPDSGPNHTDVTLSNPGSWYDATANHSHQEYSNSLASSTDPGLAAYEQRLRESGFLGGTESNTSAVDVQVGRRN